MPKFKLSILFVMMCCLVFLSCSKRIVYVEKESKQPIPTNRDNTSQRTLKSDKGYNYLMQPSSISGYNQGKDDGISVMRYENEYAVMQPGDSYKFSWFKKDNENDDVTLQRAFDFIHYIRMEGKNASSGIRSSTQKNSTSGTLLIDQDIVLKRPIEIYENITLKGDFTASNDGNFRSNTIFIDLNNSNKAAITFKRFPGAQLNYVSAKIDGIRFSALSPCRTAVDMEGASGNVMNDVMITGNNLIENGLELSFSIFCKVSNVRVENVKKYGMYYKPTKGSIGTTTEIEGFSINGAYNGIFVEYKSCNSLWLKNCTIEMTDHSAIKVEQYNNVHIENLYTENVPNETIKSGLIPIIDINSKNFGEPNGNKGMVTLSNSIISGYHKAVGTRKIVGVYVDNQDMINISGNKFYQADKSIIMKSGCNAVNWINNFESVGMTVYSALKIGNPLDNGIEKPNEFNVISAYSGSSGFYTPYTRIVSRDSRLISPIILAQNNNRLRIAEDSKDELTRYTEMWVQYGQQPGELRIAPGGTNVAATFGTNGGITVGSLLNAPPPKDGLRVHGQAIIGSSVPNPSAALQVDSKDKGFLPPRLTTLERDAISSPAAGLIIFNSSSSKHQGFNGKIWNDLY